MAKTSKSEPAAEPRKRDPEKRRRELLHAARQEFSERGLSGARVDDIVNRAGVNKQLMYYYFGDKETLYEKVLEQAYIDIRSGEGNLNLSAMPAREAMEKFIVYNFEFVQKNRDFVSLLNDENLHQARHLENSEAIKERHVTLKKIIGDVLKRGYEEGVFKRRVEPVDLYITISSLSYFYFSNIHTMSKIFNRDLSVADEIERRRGEIVAIVLTYLMNPPADAGQP
jgi:TetR/AcrR family transcriptional regulator